MAHDYIKSRRKFRTPSGEYVSYLEVRELIDKLTDRVARDAGRLAKRFDAGTITAVEFNIEMRQILKDAHIAASVVGRGGEDMMTVRDWGRVGAKIKWQYAYLDKFTRKLARDTVKANTAYRAKLYASAIYISYARADQVAQTERRDEPNEMKVRLITTSREGCSECAADEARGWVPVSELKLLGERICQDFCRCRMEFEDGSK